ncbi:MAG: DNA adenine methylase [candidate division Zixibacteria bacterium]|nr:DNA adenine methylase [candidate division Zixibacteria bacterium]MDD5425573.1 DNA adenine methylase [candidate division Zixibacteria bacterium]
MKNKITTKNNLAKPFLKWAGGKTQLLEQFENFYPHELKNGKIKNYFEPFVGSGAVFFEIIQRYNGIEKVYLNDINKELIIVYKVIQKNVYELIEYLGKLSKNYFSFNEQKRHEFYYYSREAYNKQNYNKRKYCDDWIARASQTIFLNKTCFNGLYRINGGGKFNVPSGRYKNPKIVDKENLLLVSNLLQNVTIEAKDFESIRKKVTPDSFVYFDPPYRPISETACFTSYTKTNFGENDQKRLANLFKELDNIGAKLMLSNSDPQNHNKNDNFFEEHYKGFNIKRVTANRMINCDATKRGKIKEIIITNYEV